jgi:CubicO group peptidase (beta-lactamase class C family)
MRTALLADDPRPYVTDYATGYAPDMTLGTAPQPYAPVAGFAPVGGTLASLTDMAAYVTLQLNRGTTSGTSVVSAANLAECWQPHIDIPALLAAEPYLTSAGYGMGWISQTYQDGPRLVWHNGGIDGFSTFIGFFPDDDLGLVILTNIGPLPRGLYFAPYVLNLVVNARFGLAAGANDAIASMYQDAEKQFTSLAAQAEPVDPVAVAPYLGYYEKGWRLVFDAAGLLRLRQGSRNIQLLAMPDGSYVMAGGVLPGNLVRLTRDDDDVPWLEIDQIETVRWSSGPA